MVTHSLEAAEKAAAFKRGMGYFRRPSHYPLRAAGESE